MSWLWHRLGGKDNQCYNEPECVVCFFNMILFVIKMRIKYGLGEDDE